MSDRSAATPLYGLHHVGLTVSDLERSVVFYRDLLGLSLVRRRSADADYLGRQTGYPGVRLEVASFRLAPAGGPTLELVQYVTHAGGATDPATNRAGNSHLCFQVEDIHLAYDALRRRACAFAPLRSPSRPARIREASAFT